MVNHPSESTPLSHVSPLCVPAPASLATTAMPAVEKLQPSPPVTSLCTSTPIGVIKKKLEPLPPKLKKVTKPTYTTNKAKQTQAPEVLEVRRFLFCECLKLLLCQCVQQPDAHLVGHGQQDKVFKEVLETFVTSIDGSVKNIMQKRSVKNLRDKFRNMLRARRSKYKANKVSSENLELVSDLDQLLDDLIVVKVIMKQRRRKDATN